MHTSPKKPEKKLLGMRRTQLIILAILGILFCCVLLAALEFLFSENKFRTINILNPGDPTNSQLPSPMYAAAITPSASTTNTPQPTLMPTPGVPKPPDTTENIHLALIFNGEVKNPQDESGVVDLVWGSDFPSRPKGVYDLYYYPFDRDADGNTGELHHDITWFEENHPDWIEYTCDQKTPAYEYGNPNVPLDISNPAVIEYMMQTYILPAIEQGYEGIAFDNVDFNNNGYRCGVWRNGKWVEQSNYIHDVISWAASMYSRLHALNVGVAMNFPYDVNHLAESNQIYKNLDIAVDERGFTNWGSSQKEYLSGSIWLTNMQAIQSLDANGKGFVSINEMPEPFAEVSQAEKQWAIANYLLVKGRYSYLAITGIQEYGHIFTTPEYAANIGRAPSVMYKSQNVYMRDFSNGLAIVNPSSSQSFTIILLPNTYQDLYGNNVDSIPLEPLSGIVLLRKPISTSARFFASSNISYILPPLFQIDLFP
jgi:hypothetical protein